jgi:hypothetical protein
MSTEPASPLDFLLTEIVKALNAKLFYAAICLALTIPDVCSVAETDDEDMNFKIQKRYVPWCDSWVKSFTQLTSLDLWALRGGVIHKGQTFGHPKERFERVIFILPFAGNEFQITTKWSSNADPVCMISVEAFCKGMIDSANNWKMATKDNAIVQRNLEGLLRVRPHGYQGSVAGLPVIA